MIVDSHVHLLPPRLAAAVRDFFDAHISGRLVYPSDPEVVLQSHADAGIGAVWNLPYAHRAGVAEGLNAAMAELSAELSSPLLQVVAGCTVHPADSSPRDTLRRAVEHHGARVLKLHCSVGKYELDDARLDGVWEEAASRAIPVVVHAGHSIDGTTAPEDLVPLERVLDRYPEVSVVLAHFGAPESEAVVALMSRYSGLHADLAPVVTRPVNIPVTVTLGVIDRLLFGTDAPNTGCRADRLLEDLRDRLGSEEDFRQVTKGTATALAPLG